MAVRLPSVSLVLTAAAAAIAVAPPAVAHRNACHTKHSCPSDHATYRWRGSLCVSPTADERTAKFKTRVVFGGRIYYCHK